VREVVQEKPRVLIVGTGASGLIEVKSETKKLLENKGIELIAKPTSEACRLFNEKSKNEKVIAALHLTC
jgi:hypothetical protein